MDASRRYSREPDTFAVNEKARAWSKLSTRAASYFVVAVLCGLLVLIAIASVVPALFGYESYIVKSGSMGPSLPAWSVAVTLAVDVNDMDSGDIVVRPATSDKPAILHRIVGINLADGQPSFTMRGDANAIPDEEPLVFEGGVGQKVVYHVPYVGRIMNFARILPGRLALIGIPGLLLFVTSGHSKSIIRRVAGVRG